MTNRNGCLQNPCGVWRIILLYSVKDQYFCYFIIHRADIFVSNLIEPEAAIESVNVYEHYKLA